MIDFQGFPKIPRFNRDVIITEKIDGTNAGIFFTDDMSPIERPNGEVVPFLCASRNKWVFPENDNHGFSRWAYAQDLKEWMKLGPGMHYGEWWGQGIQRTYNLKEKRFSLFNTLRWSDETKPSHCHVVPVLYQGNLIVEEQLPADDYEEGGTIIYGNQYVCISRLKQFGSVAAPGFMKPEGIVIFHTASNHMYKITLENDDKPKGNTV